MISDINLCKDIAEFAHFSIALRGGLPSPEDFANRHRRGIHRQAQAEQGLPEHLRLIRPLRSGGAGCLRAPRLGGA